MNNIYFIIISLISMFYIIKEIRSSRFTIKESFCWITASLIMLILSIFPHSMDWLAIKLKIDYPPSLFFVICIIYLILIIFRNSKKITEHHMKITQLAQELSIIKSERNEKND